MILIIIVIEAIFHWARRNDVLETIPNIDAVSKGKVVHREMYTFNSQQIRKLLSAADIKMRAMIWWGVSGARQMRVKRTRLALG